jgi:peptidoglycan/LPS O-acetylase OafA/YrhL
MANPVRRSHTLDIVRLVAIVLVLGRHMHICPVETSFVLHRLTFYWRQGAISVDIFMVLRGFLVSGLLFKEHQRYGTLSVRNFLLRRGFKIYPAFWTLILCTALFNGLVLERVGWGALLRELCFVQNYGYGLWNHTWSLAVEEHFYLLLPAVLYLMMRYAKPDERDPFRRLPMLFLVVVPACLAARLYTAATQPFTCLTNVFPTHLRIDALLFGVLLAYYYQYRREALLAFIARFRAMLFTGGVALFVPIFLWPIEKTPWIYTVGFMMCYLGSGMVLLALVDYELRPTRLLRLASFLGIRSYSIYLWHMPVEVAAKAVQRRLGSEDGHWLLYVTLYLVGAFVVGITMAHLIEFPFLKLRDRLVPSNGRPLPVGQGAPPGSDGALPAPGLLPVIPWRARGFANLAAPARAFFGRIRMMDALRTLLYETGTKTDRMNSGRMPYFRRRGVR